MPEGWYNTQNPQIAYPLHKQLAGQLPDRGVHQAGAFEEAIRNIEPKKKDDDATDDVGTLEEAEKTLLIAGKDIAEHKELEVEHDIEQAEPSCQRELVYRGTS